MIHQDEGTQSRSFTSSAFAPFSQCSPKQANPKRIPEGIILGEIPLEAAKSFPIRIWQGTGIEPRIAYADLNSHGEHNTLTLKLLPDGAKTAPHPQLVMFVKGPYHVETLDYYKSNVWDWSTWQEVHVDAKHLKLLIDAAIKAELQLEALRA